MNPSYNNSFGGNTPVGGGAPMGVAGGMGGSVGNMGGMGTNMGNQPIVSSGTGDVILSPSGGGKKSKKGLVIGVICGIVAIVAVVLVVVLMNFGGGQGKMVASKNVTERWEDYYNLLMLGKGAPVSEVEQEVDTTEETDENETTETVDINEVTVENWFPAMVDSGNYAGSSSEYYHALADRFNEFYELGKGILEENNSDYAAYVQTFLNYHLISELENEVLNKYLDEGVEVAEEYIGRFERESMHPEVVTMDTYMRNYFVKYIDFLETLDLSSCNNVDNKSGCVANVSSNSENRESNDILFDELNARYDMEDYYADFFANAFLENTRWTNNKMLGNVS